MKSINLSINPKQLLNVVVTHVAIVLWVFLALIVLAEVFVLKNSVAKIFPGEDGSLNVSGQIVRVNFNQYQKIEERITKNSTFVPENTSEANPFGMRPSK